MACRSVRSLPRWPARRLPNALRCWKRRRVADCRALDAARLNVGMQVTTSRSSTAWIGGCARWTRSAGSALLTWRGGGRLGLPFARTGAAAAGTRGGDERGAVVTVTLTEGLPEARGRQWTEEDYATRDMALAALGLRPLRRRSQERAR